VSGSWDRGACLWQRGTSDPVACWPGGGDPVNAVAFSADGARVYLGTFNGEVAEWDPAAGTSRVLFRHRGSVKSLAATPSGVVSAGRDGNVRRLERGELSGFEAGQTILNGVSASADGATLATASRRNGVELWTREGARLARFARHRVSAKSVALAAGGRIAAVYYDGTAGVWDPASGMARLEPVSSASLSQIVHAPGGWLASAWDAAGTLHLLDRDGAPSSELRIAA
jgi:WD40 repeat protein